MLTSRPVSIHCSAALGRRLLLPLLAGLVLLVGSCGGEIGTYDVSTLEVARYRYLLDPDDELVHVVVEVLNTGPDLVEGSVVVVAGIGRNGEKRGESRTRVDRLASGERRVCSTSFINRARLATVDISIEPVPQEERKR